MKQEVYLLQNCLVGIAVPTEFFRQDLVVGKILVFGAEPAHLEVSE